MRALTATPTDSSPTLTLGLPGFTFEDLYRPRGLRRLAERFDAWLTEHEPELFQAFEAYRKSGGTNLSGPAQSDLLIRVSRHVARFLARLFNIQGDQDTLARRLTARCAETNVRAHAFLLEYMRECSTHVAAIMQCPMNELTCPTQLAQPHPRNSGTVIYAALHQ